MDDMHIEPNSHKYKEEKQKIEKVVQGQVVSRKRSKVRRFADLFLAEDIGNVKEYLVFDLLIPAIKDTIVSVINNTTELLAYGRVKNSSRRPNGTPNTYVSYNSYSRPQAAKPIARPRLANSFEDIILETRGEAEAVLDTLREYLDKYHQVTVRDFLDSVGISGDSYTNFTQEHYGWTDLREAYVSRVREGYLLVMPRVIELD